MKKYLFLTAILLTTLTAFAQVTAFSYQGRLNVSNAPANGIFDFQFTLYDAPTNGAQVPIAAVAPNVPVSNGLFTTGMDFGDVFRGRPMWLQIAVQPHNGPGFTNLSPRQLILPAPYATFATTASNLVGTVPATQLTGALAPAQLPANVALRNGSNTFNAGQRIDGPLQLNEGSGSGYHSDLTLGPGGYFPGEEHSINFDDSVSNIGSLIVGYNGGLGYFSVGNLYNGGPQPGTRAFTVMGNGNVGIGIGTTNPSARLEVAGIVKATAFTGDGSGLTNLPASGGGVTLVDSNNVTLGRVITATRASATVLTSTGYQITLPFDAALIPAQIYYTGPCGNPGTGYLNDGNGAPLEPEKITAKYIVYSGSLTNLMVPADIVNGLATNSLFTAQSLDNPTCGSSSGTQSGWKLKPITRAAAGLPAVIAPPLTMH